MYLSILSLSPDPMEDQFQVLKAKKRERVAKNELQRLRNIQRAHKVITNFAIVSALFFLNISYLVYSILWAQSARF